jgi:transcriptional regulator with XRE-family HTH domain
MPSVERLVDIGTRRASRSLVSLGDEFRNRRVSIGISQQIVADAARVSRSSYVLIEQGRMSSLSIAAASRVAAVLGLELAVRAYPGPSPLREVAHAKRLARVLEHVSHPLSYRTEVALPQLPGRIEQRAWDALISGVGRRTGVEMEMRIRDAQRWSDDWT